MTVTWHSLFYFAAGGDTGGCFCCDNPLVTWHNGFSVCSSGSAPTHSGGFVPPYYCCMVTC